MFSFSLDKYPEVELLGHIIALFLIFWETFILFSIVAVPIYILTNSAQEFPFLHILPNAYFFFGLWAILTGARWCLIKVLICISLMISDNEYLFFYLLAVCMSFIGKCQFRSSAHILIGFYLFVLLLNCLSSSCIWMLTPIRYMICKYFIPFGRLSFHFVDGFLCCAEVIWFNVVQLVYFCFYYLCFCCQIQKKSSSRLTSSSLPLMVSSGIFLWFQILCSDL